MTQTADTIELLVNGEQYEGQSLTLSDLLAELGYSGQKVATAVNGDFIAGQDRATFELRNDDHVEIVAPRQGG